MSHSGPSGDVIYDRRAFKFTILTPDRNSGLINIDSILRFPAPRPGPTKRGFCLRRCYNVDVEECIKRFIDFFHLFVPNPAAQLCQLGTATATVAATATATTTVRFYNWNLSPKNEILFYGSNPASFCLVSFFSHDKWSTNLTINDKSVDDVLGTGPRGSRMEGADEATELWWHPEKN